MDDTDFIVYEEIFDEFEDSYIKCKQLPLPVQSNYNDILTFEDYEFTQCMVYELAIRNPKNKSDIEEIINLYEMHKVGIDQYITDSLNCHFLYNVPYSEYTEYYYKIMKMIDQLEIVPDIYIDLKKYTSTNIFEINFRFFLQKIYKIYYKDYNKKSNDLSFKHEITCSIINKTVKKTGFIIHREMTTTRYNNFDKDPCYLYGLNGITEKKEFRLPKTVSEFAESELEAINKNLLRSKITVSKNFKRPEIRLRHSTKNIIVKLDLSLPEKELTSFIKLLKREITDEMLSPTAFLSSLIEHENKSDQKNIKYYKNKYIHKIHILAEMLFVYDYIETTISNNQEIRKSLEANLNKHINAIRRSNNIEKNKTKKIQEVMTYYKNTINDFPINKQTIYSLQKTITDIGLSSRRIMDRYEAIQPIIVKKEYLNWVANLNI